MDIPSSNLRTDRYPIVFEDQRNWVIKIYLDQSDSYSSMTYWYTRGIRENTRVTSGVALSTVKELGISKERMYTNP